MLNNRENRMEILKNNGIETGKYFSFKLPEGLKAGSQISIIVNEDGVVAIPEVMQNTDNLKTEMSNVIKEDKVKTTLDNYNKICSEITNGYVRNSKLHRRWVMAQMFRMLNYKSWNGKTGYDVYMKERLDYTYQFEMVLNELWTLNKLKKEDFAEYEKRSRFFTTSVIMELCNDYSDKLNKEINKAKLKRCRSELYKTLPNNKDVFINEIEGKVTNPITHEIDLIKNDFIKEDYTNAYRDLNYFVNRYVKKYKLQFNTPKCKTWKDAYKGAGAYYTLMNMVKFHDCFIEDEYGSKLYGMSAVRYIDNKANEYREEKWRLFYFMKKVIEDNKFDFKARMEEIYGK